MTTLHLIPLPGTALSVVGTTLREGRLYKITPEVQAQQRDYYDDSWVRHLTDDAQRARWGRQMFQVVEVGRARPGAALLALKARTHAPFQGFGHLAAGEQLVMPADLAAQLHWLRPEVQRATHGHVTIDVEPVEGITR